MKKWLILAAPLLMAACSNEPSYRETLEGKLQGKNDTEKRALLAQECGQQIQKSIKPESDSNIRHSQKMKQICEEMTGKKVPVEGIQ